MSRINKHFSVFLVLLLLISPLLVFAHEVSWPGKRLAKLMPDADNFKQKQTTLTPAQIAELENTHNQKIGTEDRSPIFYFAYGGPDPSTGRSSVLGIVVFVDAVGEFGPIELSIAMDKQGRVINASVWEHSDTKRIQKKDFLIQFVGKTIADTFKVGEDIQTADGAVKSSQAVANGVKKGLLLIHSVFQKH